MRGSNPAQSKSPQNPQNPVVCNVTKHDEILDSRNEVRGSSLAGVRVLHMTVFQNISDSLVEFVPDSTMIRLASSLAC